MLFNSARRLLRRGDSEDEEDQTDGARHETDSPKETPLGQRGNRRDGNRDLEERHAARIDLVLVEVRLGLGLLSFRFAPDRYFLFLILRGLLPVRSRRGRGKRSLRFQDRRL